MGKILAIAFGCWAFALSGFNPLVAGIAAGIGAALPDKRMKRSRKTKEYRYEREIRLTHYPDGTVTREEEEY